MRTLGIDVGGSATRWHLVDHAGGAENSGETIGFSGHLSKPEILRLAECAIKAIVEQAGPAERVVAGVTGLSSHTNDAVSLSSLLQKAFSASSVVVMSDIELAARAVFPLGKGILVYAGTGSIAAHITQAGELITAGGRGVLIDDAGGGYWIAVAALRAILRAEDTLAGSGWVTPLGQAFASVFGGKTWPIVRTAFYALDRGGIALLARGVGEAAHMGDETALSVLRSAGQELAALAILLTNRVGPQPIILAGRAALLHGTTLEAMALALVGHSVVQKDLMTAKAAANLARCDHIFNTHIG